MCVYLFNGILSLCNDFDLDLQCRQQMKAAIAPMVANTNTAVESTMGSIILPESSNIIHTRKMKFF